MHECGAAGTWIVVGERPVRGRVSPVIASACDGHLLSVRQWLSEHGVPAQSLDPELFDSVMHEHLDQGRDIFELRSA